jgi:hypothetical protein
MIPDVEKTERSIYWQQYSAFVYAAARRTLELDWPYEATGHQKTAATAHQLAREYMGLEEPVFRPFNPSERTK